MRTEKKIFVGVLLWVLLVVTLVGIRFLYKRTQIKIVAARADIFTLQSALQKFKLDNGSFPTTADGLPALIDRPAGASAAQSEWPYLEMGIPKDPWGHAYIYKCLGPGPAPYKLFSVGPDGKEGTDDDILVRRNSLPHLECR